MKHILLIEFASSILLFGFVLLLPLCYLPLKVFLFTLKKHIYTLTDQFLILSGICSDVVLDHPNEVPKPDRLEISLGHQSQILHDSLFDQRGILFNQSSISFFTIMCSILWHIIGTCILKYSSMSVSYSFSHKPRTLRVQDGSQNRYQVWAYYDWSLFWSYQSTLALIIFS